MNPLFSKNDYGCSNNANAPHKTENESAMPFTVMHSLNDNESYIRDDSLVPQNLADTIKNTDYYYFFSKKR